RGAVRRDVSEQPGVTQIAGEDGTDTDALDAALSDALRLPSGHTGGRWWTVGHSGGRQQRDRLRDANRVLGERLADQDRVPHAGKDRLALPEQDRLEARRGGAVGRRAGAWPVREIEQGREG